MCVGCDKLSGLFIEAQSVVIDAFLKVVMQCDVTRCIIGISTNAEYLEKDWWKVQKNSKKEVRM